jgi:hypothetical protein
MTGRCCVFQPFDKGPHDKRYKDIIEPAIEAADLEPYRVDRDDGALVPIDTLHEEIKAATVCLADISTTAADRTPNPNVMYELGAAIASGRPVVIISSSGAEAFPFDIRHRTIIQYSRDSSSDFDKLKSDITMRLRAIVKKESEIQNIVTASPVKSTEGLKPNEITALALVMANRDCSDCGVPASQIRDDMERAGFTNLASGLALTSLERSGLVTSDLAHSGNFNDEPYTIFKLTDSGEDWLLDNQDRLELRVQPKLPRKNVVDREIKDNDVPF